MIVCYTVPEIWYVMDLIIFHFGPFFALFPPNSPKKILKKFKKCQEISFYTSVPKIMITCYTVPQIWHVTNVIVIFHFGLFFALLPPNSPKNQNLKKIKKMLLPPNSPENQNLKKMKKTAGDIIILQMCNKNYDQMMYGS